MLNHYSYSVTTFNFINAKPIMQKESLFTNEIIRMTWQTCSQWEICTNNVPRNLAFKKLWKNANPHEANLEILTIICLKNSKTERSLSFIIPTNVTLGCLVPFL